MKPSELKQFERSYCDCEMCKAGCKSMPGMLAPGDFDAIAEHMGVDDPGEDFARDHFVASEGALVVTADGNMTRIPTIVPKQTANGRCVFLTADDRCSIHPVSPMGCRCFKICDEGDGDDMDVSKSILSAIAMNIDYNLLHDWMLQVDNVAPPISVRKLHLTGLLEDIERGRGKEDTQEA